MSEKRTTARAFHDAVGVEDWRVLFSGAHAYYRVRSFAEAARFVAAIAEAAEVVGHFPDVDVRPEGVTVRTASGDYGRCLSEIAFGGTENASKALVFARSRFPSCLMKPVSTR